MTGEEFAKAGFLDCWYHARVHVYTEYMDGIEGKAGAKMVVAYWYSPQWMSLYATLSSNHYPPTIFVLRGRRGCTQRRRAIHASGQNPQKKEVDGTDALSVPFLFLFGWINCNTFNVPRALISTPPTGPQFPSLAWAAYASVLYYKLIRLPNPTPTRTPTPLHCSRPHQHPSSSPQ